MACHIGGQNFETAKADTNNFALSSRPFDRRWGLENAMVNRIDAAKAQKRAQFLNILCAVSSAPKNGPSRGLNRAAVWRLNMSAAFGRQRPSPLRLKDPS